MASINQLKTLINYGIAKLARNEKAQYRAIRIVEEQAKNAYYAGAGTAIPAIYDCSRQFSQAWGTGLDLAYYNSGDWRFEPDGP